MSFKEDFRQWKDHPVTRAVLGELADRVEHLKNELAQSAGNDPIMDRFKVGYIQACNDFSDIELEDKDNA